MAETYYQTAPKTGYSQGATPYTQTQQTRQVTAIKPATQSPATSTFSIYPVSSAVQPVAAAAGAAASVVPSYSQSPTYSTNAVTYSGKIPDWILTSRFTGANSAVVWLKPQVNIFARHLLSTMFLTRLSQMLSVQKVLATCPSSLQHLWPLLSRICSQARHIQVTRQLCTPQRPLTTSSSSNSSRSKPSLPRQPPPPGQEAHSPRRHLFRIKHSNPSSHRNHHKYTTVMCVRLAVLGHR